MDKKAPDSEKSGIPTNLRLLRILEIVARAENPMSPSALVSATGLPKPTLHRLLSTAEAEGYLEREVDGRTFAPGGKLRALAANALSSNRVRTERLAIMRELADEVGETCNLSAPGGDGMVYLDRVETHWPLRIQLPIGTQVPFHATASGKMYLASLRSDRLDRVLARLTLDRRTQKTLTDPRALQKELRQTRSRGYSTDDEEFMDSMVAVAVPIRDSEGRLLTTLSIHAPVQRHSLPDLVEMLPRLKEAAGRLEALCRP